MDTLNFSLSKLPSVKMHINVRVFKINNRHKLGILIGQNMLYTWLHTRDITLLWLGIFPIGISFTFQIITEQHRLMKAHMAGTSMIQGLLYLFTGMKVLIAEFKYLAIANVSFKI